MMRSLAVSLGIVVAWSAAARAQDPGPQFVAIAPLSETSFVSLDVDGVLRRHDATGAVVGTLGRAALSPSQHWRQRIEVTTDGVIVAGEDLVLRVSGGVCTTLVAREAIEAAGGGGIVDFAFDASGRRGVILSHPRPRYEPHAEPLDDTTVVLAVEDGAVRRLAELPSSPSLTHVAIDERGERFATMFHNTYPGPMRGGPLAVHDFASGRQLWRVASCLGTDDRLLAFSGRTLVACARRDGDAEVWAVAGYDAASGRVRWRCRTTTVFARSPDGRTILVDGLNFEGRPEVASIDVATGRTTAVPVGSHFVHPASGYLLAGPRIVEPPYGGSAPVVRSIP